MKLLIFFAVISTGFVRADSWPGSGGKLCFNTPIPVYEHDSYAVSGVGARNTKWKAKPGEHVRFEGPLVVEIDGGTQLSLPNKKGIYIQGLNPLVKHWIKIKNKSGKVAQQWTFTFDPSDPRYRIRQHFFYDTEMHEDPPPRKCPWLSVSM